MIRADYNTLLHTQGSVVICRRKVGEKHWTIEGRHNLVTNFARFVVRDLVLGSVNHESKMEPPTIVKLGLGDCGISIDQAKNYLPVEKLSDTTLQHPTMWIPLNDPNFPETKVESVLVDGRPAIKYTFYMSGTQGNTESGFFCEFGLCLDDEKYPEAYAFTKLNRPPIVKTTSDEIYIIYTLLF